MACNVEPHAVPDNPIDSTHVHDKFSAKLPQSKLGAPVYCHEVYKWPEFRALCERLGVPWELATKSISIEMSDSEAEVLITHKYVCRSKG